MTHYRPIAMPNMAEPVPIADQPSPTLQWVEIAAMVIDDALAALPDAWFAALRAIAVYQSTKDKTC